MEEWKTFMGGGMEDFYRLSNVRLLQVEECRTFTGGGMEDFYRWRNGGTL